MQVKNEVTKNIIYKLLMEDENYRTEILALIDAEFLQFVSIFFKKVINAKLKGSKVTLDWYKEELLNSDLPKNEIAINSGLNMKSISNVYNSATKEIVIEASQEHYESLCEVINTLAENDEELNVKLTIKFKDVSVDLNLKESLVVINTLAVKRAALRGGLWSTAGKQVEKHLMRTLCKLYDIPEEFYLQANLPASLREVDFYLIDKKGNKNRCEVKLMGKGNPESADVVIARNSQVFVADKLSELNKKQLTKLKVEWVCLNDKKGYERFYTVLKNLKIPCKKFSGDFKKRLKEILSEILD